MTISPEAVMAVVAYVSLLLTIAGGLAALSGRLARIETHLVNQAEINRQVAHRQDALEERVRDLERQRAPLSH